MAQMTALRRRMIDDMTVRNLSPATQQSYVYAVAKFSRFFDCSPDRLGIEEVRAYQLHLAGLGWSWSHINQVSCALRFFFGVTLGRPEAFDRIIAPLFDYKSVKFLSRSPISLYALGIPPMQYDELVAAGSPISVLRGRVEKLACDFPVEENYFAWQAFTRGYDVEKRQAVPAYLRRDVYDVIRTRTDRVEILHASMTGWLKTQEPASLDRFVLLDAQDWMTPAMLNALWREIDRVAARDARVIFRTAGPDSPLPRKLAPELLAPWEYRDAESARLHSQDRASIYGGFHLYIFEG